MYDIVHVLHVLVILLVHNVDNDDIAFTRVQSTISALALKAMHLCDSAFCTEISRMKVPMQVLKSIPLRLGLVMKILAF